MEEIDTIEEVGEGEEANERINQDEDFDTIDEIGLSLNNCDTLLDLLYKDLGKERPQTTISEIPEIPA